MDGGVSWRYCGVGGGDRHGGARAWTRMRVIHAMDLCSFRPRRSDMEGESNRSSLLTHRFFLGDVKSGLATIQRFLRAPSPFLADITEG